MVLLHILYNLGSGSYWHIFGYWHATLDITFLIPRTVNTLSRNTVFIILESIKTKTTSSCSISLTSSFFYLCFFLCFYYNVTILIFPQLGVKSAKEPRLLAFWDSDSDSAFLSHKVKLFLLLTLLSVVNYIQMFQEFVDNLSL